MFKFVILLAIATCALGAAIPDGMLHLSEGRIVGGSTISITTAAYTVSLQRYGSHVCGGTVYSNNVIVTSAHCVAGSQISSLRVRIGSSFNNMEGVLYTVWGMIQHDDYSTITMENDIAVICLNASPDYSTTYRNIELAYSTPANGAAATVTGWGSLWFGGPNSQTLQQVTVNIISEVNCANAYGSGNMIKSTMLCAAGSGKDVCQGEAGSPLVSGGYLVGIASWGIDCAISTLPTVYTDIAVFRDWVVSAAQSFAVL